MADEFHELLASCLFCGLHQDRPNRVDMEGLPMLLLLLDEMVIAPELLEHVGHDHATSVNLPSDLRGFESRLSPPYTQALTKSRGWRHLSKIERLPITADKAVGIAGRLRSHSAHFSPSRSNTPTSDNLPTL